MYPMSPSTPRIHQILHSNRRSFGLEIKPDGRLIVRAPQGASRAEVQAVVAKKADWINKTQAKLARQYPTLKPKSFKPGERFWYLGEQYPLKFTDRQRPPLELDGAFWLSHAKQDHAKEIFTEWYREETRQITRQLIERYTGQYGFRVNQVRVTRAMTRWGSCTGKNNLNFTFRLSMAPLAVVEYVVVHELAHLKVRNHSRAFWAAVRQIMPEYEKHRVWLKTHGPRLTLD
jgi:predicted metal-dependent hydrolase